MDTYFKGDGSSHKEFSFLKSVDDIAFKHRLTTDEKKITFLRRLTDKINNFLLVEENK